MSDIFLGQVIVAISFIVLSGMIVNAIMELRYNPHPKPFMPALYYIAGAIEGSKP